MAIRVLKSKHAHMNTPDVIHVSVPTNSHPPAVVCHGSRCPPLARYPPASTTQDERFVESYDPTGECWPHIVALYSGGEADFYWFPCWLVRCQSHHLHTRPTHTYSRCQSSCAIVEDCYKKIFELKGEQVRALQCPPSYLNRILASRVMFL